MKVCPVCKAIAFDDATICYGCLHQFKADGARSAAAEEDRASSAVTRGSAPEFLIRFKPAGAENGDVTWSCAVEMVG